MSLQETYTTGADNLFAGTQVQPVVADEVVIASGAGVVLRGTALGQVTATGLFVPVDSSAEDGSDTVVAILAADVDATSGNAPGPGYFTGEFNQNAIIFGGTDTFADHKDAARARGIFFKSTVA